MARHREHCPIIVCHHGRDFGLRRFAGLDQGARAGWRTEANQHRSGPDSGNHRDYGPGQQERNGGGQECPPHTARRLGAALRKPQGLSRTEAAHQPVRLRAAHEPGARSRFARRSRRPHSPLHGRQVAARLPRQSEDAAHARRDGQVLPQDRFHRPLQGSHQARQLLAARLPHPAMLAEGWRTLHHAALRHHARSEDRQAQRRHVPHAGLRRAHHRHALAAPEERRRALPRPPARRRSKRRRYARRSHGPHLRWRDAALAGDRPPARWKSPSPSAPIRR